LLVSLFICSLNSDYRFSLGLFYVLNLLNLFKQVL